MRNIAWRLASKQFGHLGLHVNRDCPRGLLGGGAVCVQGFGGSGLCSHREVEPRRRKERGLEEQF